MNLLLLFSDGAGAYSDSSSFWTGRIILLFSPYCFDDFLVLGVVTMKLVGGDTIRIEFDVQKRDKYGRLLAQKLGREPATPSEARQILGLKGLENVGF